MFRRYFIGFFRYCEFHPWEGRSTGTNNLPEACEWLKEADARLDGQGVAVIVDRSKSQILHNDRAGWVSNALVTAYLLNPWGIP